MAKKSELAKEAKKVREFRRLEETKRLLILAGVDPTVVSDAVEKASTMSLKRIQMRACPTAVSRRIGEILCDEKMSGVIVYRTNPDLINLTPVDAEDRELGVEVFTPSNWSLKKVSRKS